MDRMALSDKWFLFGGVAVMMSLFDMNGPLMNALRTLAYIFLCNLMFCLFSLPLFTVGASLTALFACMQAILAGDEEDVIVKQFWAAFKQNFKQATVIWLLCLVVLALFGVYYLIVSSMPGMIGRIYKVTFFAMCIVFLFGFQYIFPLQARYRCRIRDTLKNAWLLSIAALPWTVLSILLVIAALYISFFMDPAGVDTAVFLWGMVGFGILAYLNSFLFQRAFRLIEPETMEVKHKASPEALFTDEEHGRTEVLSQESRYSNPDWNRQSFPNGKYKKMLHESSKGEK